MLSKAEDALENQNQQTDRMAEYRQITDEGDLEGVVVVEESGSSSPANVEQLYESDHNIQVQDERMSQLEAANLKDDPMLVKGKSDDDLAEGSRHDDLAEGSRHDPGIVEGKDLEPTTHAGNRRATFGVMGNATPNESDAASESLD